LPKPFFLARASGLFVRFWVPPDVRAFVGSRFLVRRLHMTDKDQALLAGARMGAALSEAFARIRGGTVADIDIKDVLEKARRGETRDLTLRDVVLRDGTRVGTVEIASEADLALFGAVQVGGVAAHQAPLAPLPATPAPPAPPGPSMLFTDAFENYRERRILAKQGGDVDLKATQRIFAEVNGNKPLAEITDDNILNFERATANWPVNASRLKRYAGMSAADIVSDSLRRQKARDPELVLIADNTQRKHRDGLAAFFNWAVSKKKMTASPMDGDTRQQDHRIKRRQVRRPFRAEELAQIFDPATFTRWTEDRPHYFWAPWIALYSGARLNEIAQLYLDDIQSPHGIPGFSIGAFRRDQRVKGSNSARFVPFAKPLLDAGLLTYVDEVRAAGHHRLFPHLKYGDDYGDYLGDRFIKYLKDIGLKTEDNPDAPGMGFHWFRHTAGDAVVNLSSSNLHHAAGITGHAKSTILPGELSTYVQPAELRSKLKSLNSMNMLLPPKYVPGTFEAALVDAHALHAKWGRQRARKEKKGLESVQRAEDRTKPKDRRKSAT
jgi:hypothetical protein